MLNFFRNIGQNRCYLCESILSWDKIKLVLIMIIEVWWGQVRGSNQNFIQEYIEKNV